MFNVHHIVESKSSQIISESTCKWIPLPPLDREWTNEKVNKYFKLSSKEIKLLKDTKIAGYDLLFAYDK
jgi:hypothetical protein